jgi:hypothetical protein
LWCFHVHMNHTPNWFISSNDNLVYKNVHALKIKCKNLHTLDASVLGLELPFMSEALGSITLSLVSWDHSDSIYGTWRPQAWTQSI